MAGRNAEGQTAAVSSLTCASGSLTGAGTDACTLTLTAPAPTGGLTVDLASNDTKVAVPSTVTVAAAASSATFTATAKAVGGALTVTLTASAGGASETYAIDLVPPGLSSLTCATASITGAGTVECTVTLDADAAYGGLAFSIQPHNPNVVVSSPETVPAGASSTTFTATVAAVSVSQTSALTVQVGKTTETYTLNLIAPTPASLTCASASIAGAGTDLCTVTLTAGAPAAGLPVKLTSSSSLVSVPASVTAAAGSATATFTATAQAVTTAQTATLTAKAAGVVAGAPLQLVPAVATLTVNSSSVAFGNVDLNSPATQSVVLTSTGTVPVSVSAATVTGSGFSISGASTPMSLSPNQSATLYVTFDPSSAGAASGAVSLTTDCSMGPMSVGLSGTGVQPSYEVALTWDAPGSSADPVAGYDIYRAVSGSSTFQLLNASVDDLTSYTDSTVSNGTSYTYYVTSVDAEGNQSAPSGQFSATIP
ncbi:MAG TPA: choice-of-anchor D domain-containing protein [Acidobacteriaceae bacterium]|nr:choice-of-anchor D domain-containing protein [Acidobacteriaceae bacterium]